MRLSSLAALALAGLTLSACNQEVAADPEIEALKDRIAIEDMIVAYYGHLGSGGAEGIADFYTEDAVFDVNGIVLTGHKEIESIYSDAEGDGPASQGTFHMLLGNPVIKLDGDSATAQFTWTGIISPDIKARPELAEQGREYDLLVKQDGKWLIKKRTVIADSALPERYAATYRPRKDYDITKD